MQLESRVTAQKNKRVAIREAKAKWVDDLTEVKHINIKKDTEKVPEKELVRPLPKHARTEHKKIFFCDKHTYFVTYQHPILLL